MKNRIILGRDTGCEMTESDWNSWVVFVEEHASDRLGETVEVDEALPRDIQTDRFEGDSERLEVIVQDLWNEWCGT